MTCFVEQHWAQACDLSTLESGGSFEVEGGALWSGSVRKGRSSKFSVLHPTLVQKVCLTQPGNWIVPASNLAASLPPSTAACAWSFS